MKKSQKTIKHKYGKIGKLKYKRTRKPKPKSSKKVQKKKEKKKKKRIKEKTLKTRNFKTGGSSRKKSLIKYGGIGGEEESHYSVLGIDQKAHQKAITDVHPDVAHKYTKRVVKEAFKSKVKGLKAPEKQKVVEAASTLSNKERREEYDKDEKKKAKKKREREEIEERERLKRKERERESQEKKEREEKNRQDKEKLQKQIEDNKIADKKREIDNRSLYTLLSNKEQKIELDQNSTQDQIDDAFAAKLDDENLTPSLQKKVKDAYTILSDENKKSKYDRRLKEDLIKIEQGGRPPLIGVLAKDQPDDPNKEILDVTLPRFTLHNYEKDEDVYVRDPNNELFKFKIPEGISPGQSFKVECSSGSCVSFNKSEDELAKKKLTTSGSQSGQPVQKGVRVGAPFIPSDRNLGKFGGLPGPDLGVLGNLGNRTRGGLLQGFYTARNILTEKYRPPKKKKTLAVLVNGYAIGQEVGLRSFFPSFDNQETDTVFLYVGINGQEQEVKLSGEFEFKEQRESIDSQLVNIPNYSFQSTFSSPSPPVSIADHEYLPSAIPIQFLYGQFDDYESTQDPIPESEIYKMSFITYLDYQTPIPQFSRLYTKSELIGKLKEIDADNEQEQEVNKIIIYNGKKQDSIVSSITLKASVPNVYLFINGDRGSISESLGEESKYNSKNGELFIEQKVKNENKIKQEKEGLIKEAIIHGINGEGEVILFLQPLNAKGPGMVSRKEKIYLQQICYGTFLNRIISKIDDNLKNIDQNLLKIEEVKEVNELEKLSKKSEDKINELSSIPLMQIKEINVALNKTVEKLRDYLKEENYKSPLEEFRNYEPFKTQIDKIISYAKDKLEILSQLKGNLETYNKNLTEFLKLKKDLDDSEKDGYFTYKNKPLEEYPEAVPSGQPIHLQPEEDFKHQKNFFKKLKEEYSALEKEVKDNNQLIVKNFQDLKQTGVGVLNSQALIEMIKFYQDTKNETESVYDTIKGILRTILEFQVNKEFLEKLDSNNMKILQEFALKIYEKYKEDFTQLQVQVKENSDKESRKQQFREAKQKGTIVKHLKTLLELNNFLNQNKSKPSVQPSSSEPREPLRKEENEA